jgi:hypothetical protein
MFTCEQVPIFLDHDSPWKQAPKDTRGVAIGSHDLDVEQAGGPGCIVRVGYLPHVNLTNPSKVCEIEHSDLVFGCSLVWRGQYA